MSERQTDLRERLLEAQAQVQMALLALDDGAEEEVRGRLKRALDHMPTAAALAAPREPVNATPRWQACPVCFGSGIVSKRPGIAGDVQQWTDSVASHECPTCRGQRIIDVLSGFPPLGTAPAAPAVPREDDVDVHGDPRIYPCDDCGIMRSVAEGGTTFTVCDECWDKRRAAERATVPPNVPPCRQQTSRCGRRWNPLPTIPAAKAAARLPRLRVPRWHGRRGDAD